MSSLCRRRRRIYSQLLEDAGDYFRTKLVVEAQLDEDGARRVRTALADRGLVDALEEILNTYVVYGVETDLGRLKGSNVLRRKDKGDPPPLDQVLARDGSPPPAGPVDAKVTPRAAYERYFDWYVDPDDVSSGGQALSGVDAFWARYPLLAHAAQTVSEHHKQNVKLACRRIAGDWAQIEAAFFPGLKLDRLTAIKTTGNDFHKGGKQVLILTFALAGGGEGRVVYKPSSVEIDCRIVGDSATVSRVSPQGYRQDTSLTELLNRHNPAGPRPEGFTTVPLPTYAILPYNRDSVIDAYGYIQFLTHAPELDVEVASSLQIRDQVGKAVGKLKPAQVKASDWIATDDDQGRVFHYQLGALMGAALAVSLSDLHVQNVIAHRRLPHLIDLEEALKQPMTKLGDTYLPTLLDRDDDPEGLEQQVENDRTTELSVGWFSATGKPAACALYRYGGKPAVGERVVLAGPDESAGNRRALVRGLVDVIEALATPTGNAAVVAWAKRLDRTIARFVTVATAAYAEAGRELYWKFGESTLPSPDDPKTYAGLTRTVPEGKKVSFFASAVSARRAAWNGKRPSDTVGWSTLPFYALEHPQHAWRDYLNCDVPSFYHRLGTSDLLNSKGDTVNVAAATAWQNVTFKPAALRQASGRGKTKTAELVRYFPERPIDMIVAQLQRLRTECSTPDGKAAFLNRALEGSPLLAADFTAFGNRLHATVSTRPVEKASATKTGVT